MRDPNRIYKICNALAAQWIKYPDLRFWQLLENIKCQYGCEHGISGDMVDLWFLEDDQTLDMIRGFKLK